MTTLIVSAVLFNAAALVGVLLLSKYSVALVDEQGRPISGPSGWQEHKVPAAESNKPVAH